MRNRNIMVMTAVLPMLALAACGGDPLLNEFSQKPASTIDESQIKSVEKNTYAEPEPEEEEKEHKEATSDTMKCADLDEAEAVTGFETVAPTGFSIYESPEITVLNGKTVEITYNGNSQGSHDGEKLVIRKGPDEGKDISEIDTSQFDKKDTIGVSGARVVNIWSKADTAGEGESAVKTRKYYLATWSMSGYSYSIYVTDGMSQGNLTEIAKSVS